MITVNEITDLYQRHDKIALIKEMRSVSGLGLKEAKEALELSMVHGLQGVINLFMSYIDPVVVEQQKAAIEQAQAERDREIDNKETEKIVSGIRCACEHWRTLGFGSKIRACDTVLANFDNFDNGSARRVI